MAKIQQKEFGYRGGRFAAQMGEFLETLVIERLQYDGLGEKLGLYGELKPFDATISIDTRKKLGALAVPDYVMIEGGDIYPVDIKLRTDFVKPEQLSANNLRIVLERLGREDLLRYNIKEGFVITIDDPMNSTIEFREHRIAIDSLKLLEQSAPELYQMIQNAAKADRVYIKDYETLRGYGNRILNTSKIRLDREQNAVKELVRKHGIPEQDARKLIIGEQTISANSYGEIREALGRTQNDLIEYLQRKGILSNETIQEAMNSDNLEYFEISQNNQNQPEKKLKYW